MEQSRKTELMHVHVAPINTGKSIDSIQINAVRNFAHVSLFQWLTNNYDFMTN